MVSSLKYIALIIASLITLIGCNNVAKQDDIESIDVEPVKVGIDSQHVSAQNVFNTIISRDEILKLISQANAEYDPALLSNPDAVSNYALENIRALNFGVYGADLIIASIYEQTQESMLYFKCVNIIAKSIGVANAFGENLGDRMNANQSNRDSILNIITQAFKNADNTLRSNNRPGVSSLLVAGAWIEGYYVACQTAKATQNEAIIKAIFNQNESLNNLIELLSSSKLPEDLSYVISGLKEIKSILDSKTDKDYSIKSIEALDAKITTLRTTIISSK
ncbi:MAG: hypothetical protein IT237_08780 [Bacteroidia bacterium]|nr:hypothetical protein [Bacteroidia bacterium]